MLSIEPREEEVKRRKKVRVFMVNQKRLVIC